MAGRVLGGGVIAEADSDGLVVAAALGVDQVAQHAPVGVGEIGRQRQRPRVEPAGQHRVQLGRVHADLGQQEQEGDDADDRPERPVRGRAFLSWWVTSPVPTVMSAVNPTVPATAPGSRPRGPIVLAVSAVKLAKYRPVLMATSPASTGIRIA